MHLQIIETTVWGSLIKSLHEGRLRHCEARSLLQTFDLLFRYGANAKYKIVIAEEYIDHPRTGRAADLQRKGKTIKTYKDPIEVLREYFGDGDAAWLLSRAQKPRIPKVQTHVAPKFGFLFF